MRRCAGRSARRSLAPYTTRVRRELEVCRLRAGVEARRGSGEGLVPGRAGRAGEHHSQLVRRGRRGDSKDGRGLRRSEEHTSELQSPCNLVCRLLLEKKKKEEKKTY